uniref:putative zinc finger protein 833 n=1 Tax=Styela clava TaxID=7725 RepID=UPI00193ACA9B|nr:putative zinc finger protein 833 [Styela clava]
MFLHIHDKNDEARDLSEYAAKSNVGTIHPTDYYEHCGNEITNKYIQQTCGEEKSKVHPRCIQTDSIDKTDKPRNCHEIKVTSLLDGKLQNQSLVHTNTKARSNVETHCEYEPHLCRRGGKDLFNLCVHKQTYTEKKPYICKDCGEAFLYSSTLQTHVRIHTGERPYICKECGREIITVSNLHRHEQTHNGEKPYICKICGEAFSQSSTLNVHERIHTGKKPCVFVNMWKRFSNISDLHRRERTHTGKSLMFCKQCGKNFSQSTGLHVH